MLRIATRKDNAKYLLIPFQEKSGKNSTESAGIKKIGMKCGKLYFCIIQLFKVFLVNIQRKVQIIRMQTKANLSQG